MNHQKKQVTGNKQEGVLSENVVFLEEEEAHSLIFTMDAHTSISGPDGYHRDQLPNLMSCRQSPVECTQAKEEGLIIFNMTHKKIIEQWYDVLQMLLNKRMLAKNKLAITRLELPEHKITNKEQQVNFSWIPNQFILKSIFILDGTTFMYSFLASPKDDSNLNLGKIVTRDFSESDLRFKIFFKNMIQNFVRDMLCGLICEFENKYNHIYKGIVCVNFYDMLLILFLHHFLLFHAIKNMGPQPLKFLIFIILVQ
ncbi:hypothetical protein ACJX0J_035237 [Zea mays]